MARKLPLNNLAVSIENICSIVGAFTYNDVGIKFNPTFQDILLEFCNDLEGRRIFDRPAHREMYHEMVESIKDLRKKTVQLKSKIDLKEDHLLIENLSKQLRDFHDIVDKNDIHLRRTETDHDRAVNENLNSGRRNVKLAYAQLCFRWRIEPNISVFPQ